MSAGLNLAEIGPRFMAGESYGELEEATGVDRAIIRRALSRAGFVLTEEEARKRRTTGAANRIKVRSEARTCFNWRCRAVFKTDQDYRLCDECREVAAGLSPFEV